MDELAQLLASSDAVPCTPECDTSPIAARKDLLSSLSRHLTAELWCWEQLEPQHGQVQMPLAISPLPHRAAPPVHGLPTAPHAVRETADRRWKRKVREERRVLHVSEVANLSLVAARTYLGAMGVVVSRDHHSCKSTLQAMLYAALERMQCDVWSYDPGEEGRPKTPCRRRVADRYLDI